MDYHPSMVFHAAGGIGEHGGKQALFVGLRRNVAAFNYGAAPSGEEGVLDLRDSIRDLTFIDGQFYGVGGNAFIGRRDGPGQWHYLHLSETRSGKNPVYTHVDGYGPEDLYLLQSGKSAVLHWAGNGLPEYPFPPALTEADPPRAFLPRDLVAAPTGTVYIGSADGRLLAGRAPTGFAPFIADPQPSRDIRAMTWFGDELWAIYGTSLAVLRDNGWQEQDFSDDPEAPVAFRYMDARDGVLLVAGENTAAIYDGTSWARLFGISHDEFLEIKALEQTRGILKDLVESAKKLREVRRQQP